MARLGADAAHVLLEPVEGGPLSRAHGRRRLLAQLVLDLVGGLHELLGDECVDPVPMLHKKRDKPVGGIIASVRRFGIHLWFIAH